MEDRDSHSSYGSFSDSYHAYISDNDNEREKMSTATPAELYRELGRRPLKTHSKQDTMNSMFGFKPFADVISKKPAEQPPEPPPQDPKIANCLHQFGNILWLICFGWLFWLLYSLIGLVTFCVAKEYSKVSFVLGNYYLYPFEKFVFLSNERLSDRLIEEKSTASSNQSCSLSFALWAIIAWPILSLFHCISWAICWFFVITIPSAKINSVALSLIVRSDIKNIKVSKELGSDHTVLLYSPQAISFRYTSYTIQGMNIILLNMFPFVVMSLMLSYIPFFMGKTINPGVIFVFCTISIIPLSYYLGFALASLSAQTSFAVGAILNATFGSLIELILYFFAIYKGSLNSLVQAGITGTLLAMMLLLPGLSMIFGGIKHKEQRFNPVAAGVSGVLLLLSVVGAFTPTVYYQSYGHFILNCSDCSSTDYISYNSTYTCNVCTWTQGKLMEDTSYVHGAEPLMYFCAAILPISYIVGLIFTLKTHAHLIDNKEFETHEEAGPAPLWSKSKCILMLFLGIILFSLVAEALVESLSPTIEAIGISQTFAGFTIFALIPSVAELVNAIQFALNNNFSMSLEIGNSAAIQVSLIQMPILILFGYIEQLISSNPEEVAFTLIFPILDLFAVMISVIIVNYISIDGKANYFLGTSLVICYILIAAAFFWVPDAPSDQQSTAVYM